MTIKSSKVIDLAKDIMNDKTNDFGERLWEELDMIITARDGSQQDNYEDMTIKDLCQRVAEQMAEEQLEAEEV